MSTPSRIPALLPPYEPEIGQLLASMMPPGVAPIGLFRTFAKNPTMTAAMRDWGGYELSSGLSLTLRDREIVIDRVCARCACEYEWGVHIAFFAERAELTAAQITSLTHGNAADACWTEDRDRALIDAVDALHDSNDLDDVQWDRIASHLDSAQMLDLLMLAGWYHAISFTANAARVPLEEGAPRFADVVG